MLKVLVLLQIAALSKHDDLRASRRSERGSVTMEHVLWAVAVIGIVGIVVLAVTNYVTSEAGKIK
jgi:heme/copper-type cytochrome/quinol oxidase subunit 2